MTDTPNTPELNPQDVQDEDDLDVVVMTDEDGTEYLYDIAARMEHGDNEYVVLVPQDENDDEVVILRSEIVDDETKNLFRKKTTASPMPSSRNLSRCSPTTTTSPTATRATTACSPTRSDAGG